MQEIRTLKNNIAKVDYSYDGIPTDGLIPLYQAYTIKDNIVIQPHLKDDAGLLKHELTHVDQWHGHCCFSFNYRYRKSFRFKMEVEAFANQLIGNGNLEFLDNYSRELASNRYNINKTVEECSNNINKFYRELLHEI